MFRALVVEKNEAGETHAGVQQLDEARLPAEDVTVAVEYSTLNYKDGLCLGSGGGMVRAWPHVPGIDFAGVVEASDDPRYRAGDRVVLTGWRVGESWWGGFSEKARVKGDWLVPLPDGLSTYQAMAVGTAGFTAMLSILALEAHGLEPGQGEVLVTGAAGGVGSVAVALLAATSTATAAVAGSRAAARGSKLPRDTDGSRPSAVFTCASACACDWPELTSASTIEVRGVTTVAPSGAV